MLRCKTALVRPRGPGSARGRSGGGLRAAPVTRSAVKGVIIIIVVSYSNSSIQ